MACCCAADRSKELADLEAQKKKLADEVKAKEDLANQHKSDAEAEKEARRKAEEEAERLRNEKYPSPKKDPDEERRRREEEERRRREEEERRRREEEARKAKGGNAAKLKEIDKLKRRKEEIMAEAQQMLDKERRQPMIQRLKEEEVANLYQQYIADFQTVQLPLFSFALLETTATVTFGHLSKCTHLASMWLSIDSAVNMFGCVLLMCFIQFCLKPIDEALDNGAFVYGSRIRAMYDLSGGNFDVKNPENQKKMKGKGMQAMALINDMIKNQAASWWFWVVAACTGGLWLITVAIWIPFWSVIALLQEIPMVLTLFLASCDPTLDMTVFAFVVLRLLFILGIVYKLYIFFTTGGNMRDYVIDKSEYAILERMDAGLGVKVNDARRYKWWPDKLKPESYHDIDKIDVELKTLEEGLLQD